MMENNDNNRTDESLFMETFSVLYVKIILSNTINAILALIVSNILNKLISNKFICGIFAILIILPLIKRFSFRSVVKTHEDVYNEIIDWGE